MLNAASRGMSCLSRNEAVKILEIISSSLNGCESKQDFEILLLQLQGLLPFDYAYATLLTSGNYDPFAVTDYANINCSEELYNEYVSRYRFQTDVLLKKYLTTYQLQSWPDGWKRYDQNKEIVSLYHDFKKSTGYIYGSRAIASTKNESIFCLSGLSMKQSNRNSAIIELVVPSLHLALSHVFHSKRLITDIGGPIISVREKEVLNWLKQGKSSWDISVIFGISERTVNFHINNIMRKLNVVNRTQALAVAIRLGLIGID